MDPRGDRTLRFRRFTPGCKPCPRKRVPSTTGETKSFQTGPSTVNGILYFTTYTCIRWTARRQVKGSTTAGRRYTMIVNCGVRV